MPDLDRLLDQFDPVPDPPATGPEIRRRGDRRRRRTRTLVAAGAALAVVAIGTPLALLDRHDDAGAPTDPAAAPEASELSEDLPQPEQLPTRGVIAGLGPWRVVDTVAPPSYVSCRPDVGPDQLTASDSATVQLVAGDGPAGLGGAVLTVMLLEFDDRAAARDAAATVEGWAAECGEAAIALDASGRYTSIADVEGDDGEPRVQALGLDRNRERLTLVAYSAAADLDVDQLGRETRRVLRLARGPLRLQSVPGS